MTGPTLITRSHRQLSPSFFALEVEVLDPSFILQKVTEIRT